MIIPGKSIKEIVFLSHLIFFEVSYYKIFFYFIHAVF